MMLLYHYVSLYRQETQDIYNKPTEAPRQQTSFSGLNNKSFFFVIPSAEY